jgi:hypothetical protein
MKLVACGVLFSMMVSCVYAQDKAPGLPEEENLQDFYRTGVGVRLGWPVAAFTLKHFIKKGTAFEFIAAPQFGGASLTILAERHHETRRPGMYWYYGAGADIGTYRADSFRDYDGDYYGDDEQQVISFGLDLIMGMEAKIHNTPFSIGFDLKPHVALHNPGGSIVEGAITFKYVWSKGGYALMADP